MWEGWLRKTTSALQLAFRNTACNAFSAFSCQTNLTFVNISLLDQVPIVFVEILFSVSLNCRAKDDMARSHFQDAYTDCLAFTRSFCLGSPPYRMPSRSVSSSWKQSCDPCNLHIYVVIYVNCFICICIYCIQKANCKCMVIITFLLWWCEL